MQAELSIQRLREAFSYQKATEKPAAVKPRPTSVSVLDSPPRDPVPPAAFFAHDEPPERKVESPVSPVSTDAPGATQKAGVFYCAPASDPGAPPDAGFISIGEFEKALRLPVFTRRTTLPKRETESTPLASDSQSIKPSFALQTADERIGFVPAVSITSIEGCKTRLFGPSSPKPSPNVPPLGGVLVQLRTAAIPSRVVFGTPVQICTLRRQNPQASVQETSRVPYEVRLMALLQRDPPDRLAGCGFQALPGGQIAPAKHPTTATITHDGWQHNLASAAMQAQERALEFQCFKVGGSVLEPCKATAQRGSARVSAASRPICELKPLSLQKRQAESRPVRAQYPKVLRASLPRSAAPHPAGSIQAPRTSGVTIARTNAAPPSCVFQALTTGQFARDQARPAGTPHAEVPRQFPPLQTQRRLFELPAGRVPLSPIQAFAPKAETPKATVQCAPKRVFEVKPAALCQREIRERTPSFVPYPEVRPASFTGPRATWTQAAGHMPAPRRIAITIGRAAFALPDCTFQTLAIRQSTPSETKPALLPCTDSPRQKFRGKFAQVQSRKLDFPGCQLSVAALRVSAMPAEKPEAKVCRPSERAYEVRPLALLWRTLEPQPVLRRYRQIMPANLPRAIGVRPRGATRTQALSVALVRLTPEPPNCAFQALAIAHAAPALAKPMTRLCIAPASGEALQAPRRIPEFRSAELFSAASAVQVVAPAPGNAASTMDRAFAQAYETRLPRQIRTHPQTGARTQAPQPRPVAPSRFMATLPDGAFQALTNVHAAQAHSKPTTRLCTGLANGEVVHVQQRGLEFRDSDLFSHARAIHVVAQSGYPKSKLDSTSGQLEVRPIALHQRNQEHRAKFVRGLDNVPVLPQRVIPSLPAAARVDAVPVLGIMNRRPATVPPNCSFHSLATGPAALPMHWRTEVAQVGSNRATAISVHARRVSFTAPASIMRDISVCLEAKRDSRHIEFMTVNHKAAPLSRPLPSRPMPSWDSEWMELPQFSTWSNPAGADLARPASSTVSGAVTWAQPGNTLNLRLYPREIAAAAHAGGAAKAPAARRDIRWVAQKVPFAPRP